MSRTYLMCIRTQCVVASRAKMPCVRRTSATSLHVRPKAFGGVLERPPGRVASEDPGGGGGTVSSFPSRLSPSVPGAMFPCCEFNAVAVGGSREGGGQVGSSMEVAGKASWLEAAPMPSPCPGTVAAGLL